MRRASLNLHPDEDVTGRGNRDREITDLQSLRWTRRIQYNGSHRHITSAGPHPEARRSSTLTRQDGQHPDHMIAELGEEGTQERLCRLVGDLTIWGELLR